VSRLAELFLPSFFRLSLVIKAAKRKTINKAAVTRANDYANAFVFYGAIAARAGANWGVFYWLPYSQLDKS
jgi:hypothetical protein